MTESHEPNRDREPQDELDLTTTGEESQEDARQDSDDAQSGDKSCGDDSGAIGDELDQSELDLELSEDGLEGIPESEHYVSNTEQEATGPREDDESALEESAEAAVTVEPETGDTTVDEAAAADENAGTGASEAEPEVQQEEAEKEASQAEDEDSPAAGEEEQEERREGDVEEEAVQPEPEPTPTLADAPILNVRLTEDGDPVPLSDLILDDSGEPVGEALARALSLAVGQVRSGKVALSPDGESPSQLAALWQAVVEEAPEIQIGDGEEGEGGIHPAVFDFAAEEGNGETVGVARTRSKKEKSVVGEIVGIVVGGFVGLFIGYYLLNFFGGPRFDFLSIPLPGVQHTYAHCPEWWPEWAKFGQDEKASLYNGPQLELDDQQPLG